MLLRNQRMSQWQLNSPLQGFMPSSSMEDCCHAKLPRVFRAHIEQRIQPWSCRLPLSAHPWLCSSASLTWKWKLCPPHASLREDSPNNGRPANKGYPSTEAFCIIEGPETVMDFAHLQLQEIQDNIRSRRNAIFLLLEEVRRLRIQQKLKSLEQVPTEEESEMPEFKSFIPFLPPLTSQTLRQYYATCLMLMAGIIMFGGLFAPLLEVKLGPGGTSYKDFIHLAHLPSQLSEVDPIVASFSGGAVGVISSLIVVEINNVKQQEAKTCKYCHGTGYLACARCSATGTCAPTITATNHSSAQHSSSSQFGRCFNCSGTGKVMCPTCLCTGMAMANESNPRFDPFG